MGVAYAEVIGDPIAHSKSPAIHRFWLEKLGIPGDYRATRVLPSELKAYLESRRSDPDWRGCNLTMPLKQIVLPLLDTVTRQAQQIRAVNAVRKDGDGRLHGRNTDVHGVARSLDHLIGRGMSIILIGAGGAARAAACFIGSHTPRSVTVINRSSERGRQLLRDFRLPGRTCPDTVLPPADLVINAAPPYAVFNLDALNRETVALDMVYSPPEGAILNSARAMGMRVVDGLTMLVNQAGEAFSVFFGHAHPAEHDLELRERLTR